MPKFVKSLQEYYKHHLSSIKGNLSRRGDDKLSKLNSQDLINYYYSLYKLPLLTLLSNGEAQITPDSLSSSNKNPNLIPATLRFDVNLEEKVSESLRLQMNKPLVHKDFKVRNDKRGFFIRTKLTPGNAKQIKKNSEIFIRNLVAAKNFEIKTGNRFFKNQISNMIDNRLSCLKAQEDTISKLSKIIPLTKKTNPTSPIVPLAKKKRISINPPRSRFSEDPKIDSKILEAIIDILAKGGQTFESTPETFTKLDEYDLRNILLSFLNGYFEVRAVGEAFNKLGKTDISLLYSGNNLFVAECKFWNGENRYSETIDQLFSYLSWRENIGVLIFFVREKDFTTIIDKAKNASSSHSSFISNSLNKKAKSYFITRHVFPEDKDKTIEVHHLLFTLYFSKKS